MIQPEITEEDNQIKARRKQYLQRLRVRADRLLCLWGIVCEESGLIKAVWTERLPFYWPPLLVHTHTNTLWPNPLLGL